MIPQRPDKKKIVFLFSDTGGGHRSSSEAIIEVLNQEYPEQFEMKMVDIFREYAPKPLHNAPDFYPRMTKNPRMWEVSYRVSDGKRKANLLTQIMWPYVRQAIFRLVNEHPCDMFVSVHPFANRAILNVTYTRGLPFMTVVTDMVSAHAFWFDPRADLVIVPTNAARLQGVEHGMPPDKILVAGQPVAPRFRQPTQNKQAVRTQFGWASDLPLILLTGGGQGMGPLAEIAFAIDKARLPVEMVIVCGRNPSLLKALSERQWHGKTHLYGFVKEMPEFMAAADILVSKAGPGTISEAFIAGLPLVLYSRLPGQEDGNVSYVVEHKAGVWAPTSDAVIAALKKWLYNPEALAAASAASKSLARPEATRQIAALIANQILCPSCNQVPLLSKP